MVELCGRYTQADAPTKGSLLSDGCTLAQPKAESDRFEDGQPDAPELVGVYDFLQNSTGWGTINPFDLKRDPLDLDVLKFSLLTHNQTQQNLAPHSMLYQECVISTTLLPSAIVS